MATEGFDLERRQELQSALSSLGAAVWAEPGDQPGGLDKPIRRFLLAAGYAPDVTRLVIAVLDRYGDPEAAARAGVPARELASLIDGASHANTQRAAVPRALKAAGYPADLTRLVLTLLEKYGSVAPPEGLQVRDLAGLVEGSGADTVKRSLKAADYPADVQRLVTLLLDAPAEGIDAKDAVKRLLKIAGEPPAVTRSVVAALDPAPEEPQEPPALAELLKKAGYPADVRRRVLAAIDPPAEVELDPESRVKEALKKAGYAPDVRRRVLAAIDPPAEVELDPESRVKEALKKAGYAPDVRRRVLAAIDPPADVELDPESRVKEALKKAGYAPDVRRRVLAAIDPPAEVELDPESRVKEALKKAGYAPDVRRRVLAAIDPPAEVELDPESRVKEALKKAGYAPDVRRRVLAAIDPPADVELDPESRVKEALKKAGYAPDVRRRVLAAIDPPAEVELDPESRVKEALKKAGYAPDVRRRVLAALAAPVRDEVEVDPKKAVVDAAKRAGLEPEVRRRLLVALEPPADDDLAPEARVVEALKKAGYAPDVRRRVLAAIDPPAETEGEVDPKRAVVDAANRAGLPPEVRRRLLVALDPPADESEVDPRSVVRRTLRTTGHAADVVRLVDTILERHGDQEPAETGLRVSDLQSLLNASEESVDLQDLVRRILRLGGYRADLAQLVASLLERYGDPELAESGLRIADLQPLVEVTHHDFDAREPVRRILRAAGYRVDLINFVELLLDRYTGSDVPSTGVRIRDLSDLVEDTDEKLLALMRHWRTAAPDDHLLGNELATVLGRRGVEPEVARDLAAAIENDSGDGQLVELARVARFALSAEDACVSMAEPAWLEAPAFAKAYAEAKGISAWGRDIRWRVQTLVKAAAAARHLEGDFVECGVDTGGTARAVMAYLGDEAFADRTFYLFDTFHGIVPEQLLPDEPAPIEDRYPDVADVARANFADKPYARIVEGTVPETLGAFTGTKVAYLHIDMNAAYPEVEALRFFWNYLTPGALVVFDDYGFPRHRAQRRALDDVAASLGVEIMMLPTCQGIVVKPPEGV